MIAGARPEQGDRGAARRRIGRIVVVVALLVAVVSGGWLLAGRARAESVARDYFSRAHGASTVTSVSVDSVSPAVPPFWEVKISGDIVEPGRTAPAYRSYIRLWVEPVTGAVLVNGAG